MNPAKLLKNIDMGAIAQFGKVLESIHGHLEAMLKEQQKTNELLNEIKEIPAKN